MNLSRVAFGVVSALGVGMLVSACTAQASITIKPKTKYVNNPDTVLTAQNDWNGEAILIEDDSTGIVASSTGGLQVVGDPNTKKVTATARIIAYAEQDKKADADQSIAEAITTFTLTQDSAGIHIKCGHGGSHGSSNGGESGCESLTIKVPSGSVAQPANVQAACGNGDVTISGIIGSVKGRNNDGLGLIDASVTPTKGSTVDIQGGGDITLRLPATFAADTITLSGGTQDTSAFPDVKSGKGFGNPGDGAKSITLVTSKSDGVLKLTKQ